MGWKAKHSRKLSVFMSFFHFWEALKRCLSNLGAVLEDVGSRVVLSQVFWTCWRQDGEQEGQDGDQESHNGDLPRWVMIAPRLAF